MSSLPAPLHQEDKCGGCVEDEEEQHFIEVIASMKLYSRSTTRTISKYIDDYEQLPEEQKEMIPFYRERLDAIAKCTMRNQNFLDEICYLHQVIVPQNARISAVLQDNIRSLFRQLVRDWSILGCDERESTYSPILEKLSEFFIDPAGVRVLVPGAGLGRLVYELANRGFDVQGNEFSLIMLFTSELILNHSSKDKWDVYPFLFPFSNVITSSDQCTPITVPDLEISSTLGNMSMTAGDFLEVYGREEEQNNWDCVVTCFFLDTAPNILKYLETIKRILKQGGYWINLGPLLYHFEGNDASVSIELTLEELTQVIEKLGYRIHHRSFINCSYVQNPKSMLKTVYESSFMVMQLE